ncbi:MAG: M16 family metallopeptidase [Bacteroidota bacterium]
MRPVRRWLLIFSILISVSPWAEAANLDFHLKTMPNGLKVIYKVIPSNMVTANMIVPTGTLNEPRGLRGISHLLEHLIYRGTENSAASNFRNLLIDDGGTYNGFTFLERTEYFLTVPSENFPKALSFYLEMLFQPQLDETYIGLEKKIIGVENVLRSQPGNAFFLYLNELTEHLLDHGVSSITREDLVHYHQQFYNPQQMTLIVTGVFKPEELFDLLKGIQSSPPENTFTPVQRLIRDLPKNVTVEDYLNGEAYQILFGFELNGLTGKDLTVAKTLPLIFEYESYQYDYLTNRPLDYDISLFNLTDRFYLVFTYRDCQNQYSLDLNIWHQENLARFFRYLQTKNFDNFLHWLAFKLNNDFQIIASDPVYLNDYYKNLLFEPSSITTKDLTAIRRLKSKDISNFVTKYLKNSGYQKVVIKAL